MHTLYLLVAYVLIILPHFTIFITLSIALFPLSHQQQSLGFSFFFCMSYPSSAHQICCACATSVECDDAHLHQANNLVASILSMAFNNQSSQFNNYKRPSQLMLPRLERTFIHGCYRSLAWLSSLSQTTTHHQSVILTQ